MIHKYYTFADKKIKVIMYNERIDQASEDLLKELIDKDEVKHEKEIEKVVKKYEAKKVVKADKKKDNLKYEFKKRRVDLKEDDFPDLLGGGIKSEEKPPTSPGKSNPDSPDKAKEEDEKQQKAQDFNKLEETLKTGETVIMYKKKKDNRNKNNKNNKNKNKKKIVVSKSEFPTLGSK